MSEVCVAGLIPDARSCLPLEVTHGLGNNAVIGSGVVLNITSPANMEAKEMESCLGTGRPLESLRRGTKNIMRGPRWCDKDLIVGTEKSFFPKHLPPELRDQAKCGGLAAFAEIRGRGQKSSLVN